MNSKQALVGWMGVGLLVANIFEGPNKVGLSSLLLDNGNQAGSGSGSGGVPSWLDPLAPLGPLDPESPLKKLLGGLKKIIPGDAPAHTPQTPSAKSAPEGPGRKPVVAPPPNVGGSSSTTPTYGGDTHTPVWA